MKTKNQKIGCDFCGQNKEVTLVGSQVSRSETDTSGSQFHHVYLCIDCKVAAENESKKMFCSACIKSGQATCNHIEQLTLTAKTNP